MTIPPEIAWLIPIVIPFTIGLLVGAIIKRTVTLVLLVFALVVILAFAGYLSLTVGDFYDRIFQYLPKVAGEAQTLKNILPYSSISFIVGLAIGLWKG
jgi:uncharacterized membrane protein (Fun14 family)